ncbi:hypothetical protein [Clostridium perfringens]|uniref:hypothetical protein n=1 Tax=Clostridium perfringens TaxID=1502 RepID=UPI00232C4227|nr:hypothetical protein [Clostridium perfringens]MDB2049344.1 hypothetical protein [Clostridium perfringens]
MNIVRKTIKHQDGVIKLQATLNMKCIYLVKEDLAEKEIFLSIPQIFSKIADFDADVLSSLIIRSVQQCMDMEEEEIMILLGLDDAIELVGALIKKCMPKNDTIKKVNEIEFEDDEEDVKDWDFDFMSYLWSSVLKRSDDFFKSTPKYFFKQIDNHKKFNNIKDEKENVEYI